MMDELKKRVLREKDFHNSRYEHDANRAVVGKYYNTGGRGKNEYIEEVIGVSNNKSVLEVGCGNGTELGVKVSKIARAICSIDISEVGVDTAKNLYEKEKGDDCILDVRVMDVHSLEYEDSYFDVIFATAVIHHLSIEVAIKEIHRVLKPGGVVIFYEPLGHNFFINLYRKFTPEIRSPDEEPLLRSHINIIRNIFSDVSIKTYGLFTIFGAFLPGEKLKKIYGYVAIKIDFIVCRLPFVKWYAWYAIIKARK